MWGRHPCLPIEGRKPAPQQQIVNLLLASLKLIFGPPQAGAANVTVHIEPAE
jgi:hypothetical protein